MSKNIVLSVVIAAFVGIGVGWFAKSATEEAAVGAQPGPGPGPGPVPVPDPKCSGQPFDCVVIQLNDPGAHPNAVQGPRGSTGQPPIMMTPTQPPEVDPDNWNELRFHPADAGDHDDDEELGPTGCHYWVEYNSIWYKLHC